MLDAQRDVWRPPPAPVHGVVFSSSLEPLQTCASCGSSHLGLARRMDPGIRSTLFLCACMASIPWALGRTRCRDVLDGAFVAFTLPSFNATDGRRKGSCILQASEGADAGLTLNLLCRHERHAVEGSPLNTMSTIDLPPALSSKYCDGVRCVCAKA